MQLANAVRNVSNQNARTPGVSAVCNEKFWLKFSMDIGADHGKALSGRIVHQIQLEMERLFSNMESEAKLDEKTDGKDESIVPDLIFI